MASWPRDEYVRAVFESNLKPLERLVALVYADHAGSESFAWVTLHRLQDRTGLSRDAAHRALKGLVASSWLVLKEKPRQHYAARYWLRIPGQQSVSRTPEESSGLSPVPLNPPSSTSPVARSTPRVPDYSSTDHKKTLSGTPDGLLDATDHHRAVAEALVRKHSNMLPIETALAAVVAIDRSKQPGNLLAYTSRIELEDLLKRGGARPASPPARAPGKCSHGKTRGREVQGYGQHASRICSQCEAEDPAPTHVEAS